MKVDMPVGIKNKFTFHVDDIVTGEHKEYEAFNIVLNSMWSRLVNFQTFFVNIHFGTGAGTFDDPARTSLYTHLGTKTATTEFQTRALPTSQWRRKIVLNPEEYIGATITEIGVAYGSTASNLVTHASPKDAEGNPIAIGPKTDTQIITIYADMYFVLAENMYGGKIIWDNLASNSFMGYLMGGTMPTLTFSTWPASGGSGNILPANWVKDTANKKATTPVMRLANTVSNGEVRKFSLGNVFTGEFPIPNVKESTSISENIGSGDGVKTGFNLSWNDPRNLIAKINDIVISEPDYVLQPKKKNVNIIKFLQPTILSGVISNPELLTDGSTSGNTTITSIECTLGFDTGLDAGDAVISSMGVHTSSLSWAGSMTLYGCESGDYSGGNVIAVLDTIGANRWANIGFENVSYRYYKITLGRPSGGLVVKEIELTTGADQITFTTPPPAGSVITADYTVDYIPKDEFHVLDLQAAIQFGEVI